MKQGIKRDVLCFERKNTKRRKRKKATGVGWFTAKNASNPRLLAWVSCERRGSAPTVRLRCRRPERGTPDCICRWRRARRIRRRRRPLPKTWKPGRYVFHVQRRPRSPYNETSISPLLCEVIDSSMKNSNRPRWDWLGGISWNCSYSLLYFHYLFCLSQSIRTIVKVLIAVCISI